MARLIKWHSNVIDPGWTASGTVLESEQGQSHLAEFDIPPSAEEVYALRQMPQFFSQLIGIDGRPNPNLMLVGRELQQIPDAPQVIRVRCAYSNKWQNEQNGDTPNVKFAWIQNPLQRPAMVEWGTYVIREAIERALPYSDTTTPNDTKEIPITTTAGEPIILEEEYHRRMLTIQKNVKQVDEAFAENSDYINEEDTRIGGHLFKKLTLWLTDVSIGHVSVENNVLYYPVIMKIYHNPKTWIRRIRNQGLYMKDLNHVFDKNGDKVFPMRPIELTDGSRTQTPIYLDSDGHPLTLKIKSAIPRADGSGIEFDYVVQAADDFGRFFTEAELKNTIRYFRTKPLLNFTKKLPLF